jgi:hypothetical protein
VSALTITYAGLTLFDGEVEGFRWDDVPGQSVTVTGQLAKPKAAGGGGLSAVVDMIAQASKAKTAEKRRELAQSADTNPETVEDAADD